ncbi:hypothetical protein PFICI_05646 [Pestalotiopsis fici W106-1]|uniref:Uncharacterized protein n=1 Tax=Pestalotiopsis fici (strain W106-1 / CGMCC3.15140) TaxID=1229662 RepID=W3XCJ3_PESFW|nr:uncharacterized protein PFICI_05646 [Pestalotiopsis fici W106-1]ETS83770.1 hypothetical protein PFICI_05646 [Pestalotiopsis fici W106-1]
MASGKRKNDAQDGAAGSKRPRKNEIPATRKFEPREKFRKVVQLPKQNGPPAKDIHLIPLSDLNIFIGLTRKDIQRQLRARKENLSENGTKVELYLRLIESRDREAQIAFRDREAREYVERAARNIARDFQQKIELERATKQVKGLFLS